jgi:hypothetical protein
VKVGEASSRQSQQAIASLRVRSPTPDLWATATGTTLPKEKRPVVPYEGCLGH